MAYLESLEHGMLEEASRLFHEASLEEQWTPFLQGHRALDRSIAGVEDEESGVDVNITDAFLKHCEEIKTADNTAKLCKLMTVDVMISKV